MTSPRLVLTRGLMLVALVAVFAGCGAALPTGRFDALAAASKGVENKTRETDADIVKLTRRFMIFTAQAPYKDTSFKPEIDGMDFDFGPRLAPRLAALDVLASYTQALAAFARKDYQGDLDQATQSLGGSVTHLAGHPTVSEDAKKSAGVLATVVNELGRAYIERMRRAELKKAMSKAQPGIEGIVKFVTAINRDGALAVETMRKGIITKANALKPSDGMAKLQLNEAVEAVIVDTTIILAELTQESAAVEAIGPAHAEVRDSLDKDDRTSLEKLKALVAEVKRLQGALSSLK
ncbi:MAG TPA: hypothetical protein VK548_19005 [Candidatus Acidoferrum sp.]|nr:hypothetical protein [Candidatus Acidoferrum sp.]